MQQQSQHGTVQRGVAAGADQAPSSPRHRQGRRRSGPPPSLPTLTAHPTTCAREHAARRAPATTAGACPLPFPYVAASCTASVPTTAPYRRGSAAQSAAKRGYTGVQRNPNTIPPHCLSTGAVVGPAIKDAPKNGHHQQHRRHRRVAAAAISKHLHRRAVLPRLCVPLLPAASATTEGGGRLGGPRGDRLSRPLRGVHGRGRGGGRGVGVGRRGTTTMPRGGSRLRGPRTAAVGARVCRSSSERTGGNGGGGGRRR